MRLNRTRPRRAEKSRGRKVPARHESLQDRARALRAARKHQNRLSGHAIRVAKKVIRRNARKANRSGQIWRGRDQVHVFKPMSKGANAAGVPKLSKDEFLAKEKPRNRLKETGLLQTARTVYMKQNTMLQLEKITTDGGTQARAALNEDVVTEYAEAITAGAEMPPVTVYHDGKKHWLADGFHRYFAHVKARAIEIAADVRTGTKRDAILYSVGANGAHGLRRSNEDKRCAVRTLLADPEWKKWSDRQIADACGVSQPFVSTLRKPEVADRQKTTRKVSAARGDNGLHAYKNNNLKAKNAEKSSDDGYFPWSTKAVDSPAKPVEKPEPHDDEGPTLAELVDELKRENDTLRAQLETAAADDLRAEAVKWCRIAKHAQREQSVLMDNAAKAQEREKFIVRMLRRCAKAVGVADPNHTDPRDIVKAVESFAGGSRHAA